MLGLGVRVPSWMDVAVPSPVVGDEGGNVSDGAERRANLAEGLLFRVSQVPVPAGLLCSSRASHDTDVGRFFWAVWPIRRR